MALNILIVDDSTLTRKALKKIIDMVDWDIEEIFEAENGKKALEILQRSRVDLVLTDLNMPEMPGFELISKMKENKATQSIPIIVITTEIQTWRTKQLFNIGIKSYLHKPFTPKELREILQKLWTEPSIETGNILAKALSQALETMAFLTIISVENTIIPKNTVLIEIGFKGPKNGVIQILADIDFGRVIAETISCSTDAGDESSTDAGDESSIDALKELANVTCGLVLSEIMSSTSDLFDVTVPIVKSKNNPPKWNEFVTEIGSCVLNIEGDLIASKLLIEEC